MTFEELLEKVKAANNLRRVIQDSGATYIRESFASDEYIFGWVVKHPAKGFEENSRQIGASVAPFDKPEEIQTVMLMPIELFMFREALALNADFYEEDEVQP